MKRLTREYWRLVWHGYPSDFGTFLEMGIVERIFQNEALNWLIDQDAIRPSDLR